MATIINKIVFEDIELLPDIVDTPLWNNINPERIYKLKKSDRQIAYLYSAIRKRENYYQEHTPTAFGDPQHSLYCGIVTGILQVMEATEDIEDDKIVIRRNRNVLLIVDKLKRPSSYYEVQRENRELLKNLGL